MQVGKVVHPVPARLLVDDTYAYILTSPRSRWQWWQLIWVDIPNQLSVALSLKWPSGLVMLGDTFI